MFMSVVRSLDISAIIGVNRRRYMSVLGMPDTISAISSSLPEAIQVRTNRSVDSIMRVDKVRDWGCGR